MPRTRTREFRKIRSKRRRRCLKGEEVHIVVRPIVRTIDKPRLRRCRHLGEQRLHGKRGNVIHAPHFPIQYRIQSTSGLILRTTSRIVPSRASRTAIT